MTAPTAQRHELRRTMAGYPTGLVTVAALHDDGPVGLIASSFTSVSLDPPLVSVAFANSSSTLPRLLERDSWGVSILASNQDAVVNAFREPADRRFATIGWLSTDDGAVHLDGAAAVFTTSIHRIVPAGDHVIALLKVEAHAANPEAEPLVFYRSGVATLRA